MCQVITVNAKESQEPEQLPALLGEHLFSPRGGPSPTSCCQLQDPCPEASVVGLALAAPLSRLAEFNGVDLGLAEFPPQSGRCWSKPLAGSGTAWAVGSMVPSACKLPFFPKQAKIPHVYTGMRPEHPLFCWEMPCFSEMRNKMVSCSFPKGHWCRCWCRHLQASALTLHVEVELPGSCRGAVRGAGENSWLQGMDFAFWESVTHFHDIALKFAVGKQSFTLKSLILRENVIFMIFFPVYCTYW